MAQQLNLYGPSLRRQHDRYDARLALRVVLAALLACVLLGLGLAWLQRAPAPASLDAGDAAWRAQQVRTTELKAELAAKRAHLDAELARVRGVEQAIARVQQALQADRSGERSAPYSAYFEALARQAHPQLWITGFTVSADGQSLELRGRALDPAALPDYLARLNAEPVFRGRQFSQLSLGAVPAEAGSDGAGGLTEFTLRSGTPPADLREVR